MCMFSTSRETFPEELDGKANLMTRATSMHRRFLKEAGSEKGEDGGVGKEYTLQEEREELVGVAGLVSAFII